MEENDFLAMWNDMFGSDGQEEQRTRPRILEFAFEEGSLGLFSELQQLFRS